MACDSMLLAEGCKQKQGMGFRVSATSVEFPSVEEHERQNLTFNGRNIEDVLFTT